MDAENRPLETVRKEDKMEYFFEYSYLQKDDMRRTVKKPIPEVLILDKTKREDLIVLWKNFIKPRIEREGGNNILGPTIRS